MGRKHQHTRRASAAATAAAGGGGAAAATAEGTSAVKAPASASVAAAAPPGAVVPFLSAGLAARAAAGVPRPLARLVEALQLGAAACLCGASCARLAGVARAARSVVEAVVAEQVLAALEGGSLLADAPHLRDRPLLALSHLESLAHSPFLFGACRELLAACCCRSSASAPAAPGGGGQAAAAAWSSGRRSAVLLDVEGGEEDLSKALLGLAFSDIAKDEGKRSSVAALLSALVAAFPCDGARWETALGASLQRWARGGGKQAPKVGDGGSLGMFLHGVGKLLPTTKVAQRAAENLDTGALAASLFCQVLERLVFPSSTVMLALHLAFPLPPTPPAAAAPNNAEDGDGSKTEAEAAGAAGAGAGVAAPADEDCLAAVPCRAVAGETAARDSAVAALRARLWQEASEGAGRQQAFEVWALRSGRRYYVLLLE